MYLRRGGISAAYPKQVLVTINDVAMSRFGRANVDHQNPDMVEAIEFTNRLNPLYGGTGDFTGPSVAAIYTKTQADAVRPLRHA